MSQQRRKEEECSVDSGASEFVRLSFAAALLLTVLFFLTGDSRLKKKIFY